ncbi:unnamed protein product, partial [Iphiclides podalirius]
MVSCGRSALSDGFPNQIGVGFSESTINFFEIEALRPSIASSALVMFVVHNRIGVTVCGDRDIPGTPVRGVLSHLDPYPGRCVSDENKTTPQIEG